MPKADTGKYTRMRRRAALAQAAMLLGLPFIEIGGESALRFDVPALRLHFFGAELWMEEFFILLLATLFVTFLIVWITFVWGRLWCGWTCPQTVLCDLTGAIDDPRVHGVKRVSAYAGALLLSLAVGADIVWYFVSPYEFLPALINGGLDKVAAGSLGVLSLIVFLDLALMRRTFCRTICPYAKLQTVLSDSSTMVIAYDEGRAPECMGCEACVRCCPVGIDIRKGLNAACVSCAACVDACTRQTVRVRRRTLIDYVYGRHGGAARPLRPTSLVLLTLTLLFLVGLIFAAANRNEYEMSALPDYTRGQIVSADGRLTNAYTISVDNHTKKHLTLKLAAEAGADQYMIYPDAVEVPASGSVRTSVLITGPANKRAILRILAADAEGEILMESEAVFRPREEGYR